MDKKLHFYKIILTNNFIIKMIKIWIIGLLITGFLIICGIMFFTKHKQCFIQPEYINVNIKNNATYAVGCIRDTIS